MSLFHRSLRVLAAGSLCGVVALSLTACSAKPENSPVIRKKLAEVDEMKEQLDASTRLLTSLNSELSLIRDEISNLRAFTPDGAGATAVINRLEAMEKRLSEMEVTTTTMAAAPRPSAPASTTTTTAATSSAPASTTTAAAPATTSPASSFPRLATIGNTATQPAAATTTTTAAPAPAARTTTAAAAPATRTDVRPVAQTAAAPAGNRNATAPAAAPRGRYYTIQSGDTLEKIATENNVSVSQLREANRLPSGARPLPGQRLFVPAGN